jgi:quercetin dioxygenase-like cupin family protein
MKFLYPLCFLLFSFTALAQNTSYAISSYTDLDLDPARKAPNTHYLGSAWLKGLAPASEDIDFNVTLATFKANSTLDWHKHETGQVLIVVSGKAYYQERGKDAVVLNEGDVIKCDKQVEHWHSASKESDVSYIAVYGNGAPTTWTQKVSQDYYDQVAQALKNQ